MITKLAEYTLQPEAELDIVFGALKEFLTAIRINEPETRYEIFQREENLTFLHLMQFSNENAEDTHRKADYTKRLVTILYPRCEAEPHFTTLTELR